MYNNSRFLTFDEITNMLKKDKPILNKEMYDYLDGVINLEYSVVKDLITNEQRVALNDLKLYRNALLYNIQELDCEYYNKEYLKGNPIFFWFYINKDSIPTITLFNRIATESSMNDPNIKEKNYNDTPLLRKN